MINISRLSGTLLTYNVFDRASLSAMLPAEFSDHRFVTHQSGQCDESSAGVSYLLSIADGFG